MTERHTRTEEQKFRFKCQAFPDILQRENIFWVLGCGLENRMLTIFMWNVSIPR